MCTISLIFLQFSRYISLWQFSTPRVYDFSSNFILFFPEQCEREGFFQKIHEEKGEGCNIKGFLEVNKVAGTFHFIPGKTFHLSDFFFSDFISVQNDNYNVSSDDFFCYLIIFICFYRMIFETC